MKIFIRFSYDGSKFYGFQRQKTLVTVQGEIERILSNEYKEPIQIKGSGRTDSKVHAYNQCAHFEVNHLIKNLKNNLNKELNNIHIKELKVVNEDFHARFSVKKKIYIYKLTQNNKDDKNYYGFYYGNISIKKMKEASKLLVGRHIYKNFVAGQRDNYESAIYKIKIVKFNKRIYFIFTGKSFYRYMVRNLVGALIDVGKNKATLNDIKDMLENYDTPKTLSTAKAEGLYLYKVKY